MSGAAGPSDRDATGGRVSTGGRIGIIGCGVISRAYAATIARIPDLALVACADLERTRADELAEHVRGLRPDRQVPRVLTPQGLLADPDVDVVLNLTVPIVHAEVTRAVLDAGKHVYSEKPLALDADTARPLVELADARGLRVGCAPDTFLGAGLQTCRALIDSGVIGEPLAATAFFQGAGPESWHPRPQIFYQRGGGPMLDMGPYYVTALVALLGPVRRVTGSARISGPRRMITSQPQAGTWMDVEVPTHVVSVLDHAAGPVATLITSFDVQATRSRWIEIHGTEATLAVPDPNTFGGPVQIRHRDDSVWTDVPLTHANAGQSRGIGLADMVRAERTGRAHRASGTLALHVLEVMGAAAIASGSGQHQDIRSTCERPAPLPPGLPDDDTGDAPAVTEG